MSERRGGEVSALLQRVAPWAAILFAVLMFAGFMLVQWSTPETSEPGEWPAFFDDSGNRTEQILGAYLVVLSAVAFLVFALALTKRYRAGDGADGALTTLGSGLALLFVAFLVTGILFIVTISASITFGDAAVPDDGNLGIQFEQMGFSLILLAAAWSAGGFIALMSLLGRRAGAIPAWLAWAGFVAAVGQLAAVAFIPLVLVPLWALLTGVTMLSRGATSDARSTASARTA